MTTELKSCPFCGSKADMAFFEGVYSISCMNLTDCGAQGPFKKAAQEARNGWNGRIEQASQPQMPEGYKLMPIKPTWRMCDAISELLMRGVTRTTGPAEIYNALLASAPEIGN